MTNTDYQNLHVWEQSVNLVVLIYKLTQKTPLSNDRGLISQIQRAAVSIPSNIAEGFKRKSKPDSVHFYNIAEASLEEMKYQLLLSRDLKYISDGEYVIATELADETGKILFGWLKSQRIYI